MYQPGWYPTRQQELLLRAALLDGDSAKESWKEWRSAIDIDLIDLGSRRLLPLLYRNLNRLEIHDSSANTYKGVFKLAWYKNQVLFHQIAAVLKALHLRGIRTMILKGAALGLAYYPELGLRPMCDVDLLVPVDQVAGSFDVLMESGWRPKEISRDGLTGDYLHTVHAATFLDSQERELDLHWHVLAENCQEGADADFWQGAVAVTVHDVETLMLNATDQLLNVCVHGARWNDVPSIRWAADAMMILQGAGASVDWQRLLAQCQKRLLVLPMRDTLSFLASTLEAPVPDYVLERLREANSDEERLDYEFRSTAPWDWPSRKPSILGLLPVAWFRHRRQSGLTSDATNIRKLLKFPGYFKHFFHVDRSWKLPFFFAYKCGQRIYRMFSWHTKRAVLP